MNYKIVVGIIGIILLVVALSGCTSDPTPTPTSTPLDEPKSWDACPYCGANDGESLSSDGNRDLCKCQECGKTYYADIPEYLK